MKFVIRTYRPGDEGKINDMFNEVFHQQRDLPHWYWKYRDNPLGSHYISLAFAADGTLAAHYGGYPVMFYLGTDGKTPAREFLSFHLGDKMTRKKFRGAGLGKNSLLARTFQNFRDSFGADVPFGYGFGTHHSLKFGLMFLNYIDVEPVPYRRLPMEVLKKMKPGKRSFFGRRICANRVSAVDDRWTDFFYEVAPHYKLLIRRDAAYVRWRYLSRPDRDYLVLSAHKGRTLNGWSVFFREGARVIWGDALFSPGESDSLKAILSSLCGMPMAEGAEYIECWFPPRPAWWDRMLAQLQFCTAAEPNNLHLTGPMFFDTQAADMLRKYFYYAVGDSDLF